MEEDNKVKVDDLKDAYDIKIDDEPVREILDSKDGILKPLEKVMEGEICIGYVDATEHMRRTKKRPRKKPEGEDVFLKNPMIGPPLKPPQTWACNVCRKEFVSKSNLQIHTSIHTGERYVCDICRKCFTQKCNLRRHEATHLGTKLFSCVRCPKKFTQKANLQRHWVTHSGKRNYSCEECGKSYIQKCNLKTHMAKHAENISFPFVECVLYEDST